MAQTQFASHGRGGAGNMSLSGHRKITSQDLATPTLKTAVVTTGRGGTGNMAPNKNPIETRLRQDVEPVTRRSSSGTQHWGRGGAGNVFTDEEAAAARTQIEYDGEALDDDALSRTSSGTAESIKGLAEKGKNWLLGRKKSESKH